MCNGHSPTDTGSRSGVTCNGHVTAMAVGQRQRLCSGVRMFAGNYLSSTPRDLRVGGVQLELTALACCRGFLLLRRTGARWGGGGAKAASRVSPRVPFRSTVAGRAGACKAIALVNNKKPSPVFCFGHLCCANVDRKGVRTYTAVGGGGHSTIWKSKGRPRVPAAARDLPTVGAPLPIGMPGEAPGGTGAKCTFFAKETQPSHIITTCT
jgi:hypothetical protein